jgi:hypothetical protein
MNTTIRSTATISELTDITAITITMIFANRPMLLISDVIEKSIAFFRASLDVRG